MMKTVLLVIDGMTPRRDIFNYAIQFCQRIKADLNVLQIVDTHREYLDKIGKKIDKARNFFEKTMMAATFAEADAPEIAEEILGRARDNTRKLLPEIEKAGGRNRYAILAGDLRQETVEYVNKHRDIVVAILDTPEEKVSPNDHEESEPVAAFINRRIPVPLVVVKNRTPLSPAGK